MNRKQINTLIVIGVIVVVIGAILFLAGPFYILNEGEQAVIVRFGEIVDVHTDAGLHVKLPFIDNVVVYSKKVMSWDGNPREMPTSEKQYIWVDVTARWRIDNPEAFYAQVNTLQEAYGRLSAVIESAVRTVVAESAFASVVRNSNTINEVKLVESSLENTQIETESSDVFDELLTLIEPQVTYPSLKETEGRRNLSDKMLSNARPALQALGIELIDVLIRQIRYADDVTESVYNRMISERNRIAQAYRSVGEGRKSELLGQMQNELLAILSDAYRQAEIIKGTADAQATRIYSIAYSQDPDFFSFWRAMESYRKTLSQFDKTLTTDADYFRYLYSINGR